MSVEDTGPRAVRGWECTPTEEEPPTTAPESKKRCLPESLIKGWRRTALYGILVVLMLLIFLNITLTLWIVGALKLSMDGVGPIKIVNGGIQLRGQAWVMDNLVASTITTPPARPLTLHSHRNFTIQVAQPDTPEQSKLLIKRDSLEFRGRALHVRDARGESVFQATKDEVKVFADALAVDAVGGVNVQNAIQVPLVRAPPASNLQLESLTRRLDLRAPHSIYLESRAGSIDITAHGNIKLDSIVGAIKIDAPNIIINHLKEATVTNKPQRGIRNIKVYQLCACATGKLFLAAPEAPCASNEHDTELCR